MKAMIMGAALLLAAAPLCAGGASQLAGTWRATPTVNGMPCTLTLVISPGATYSQTVRCGMMATMQSGPYRLFPNGTLTLGVTDWMPRTHMVVMQGGTHVETNARPPGGSYVIAFRGPNVMVWRDTHYGGAITLRRT
jgi:hypothetical protein